MRIHIADAEKQSIFPSGSAEIYDYTGELLGQIMVAIGALPNDIALIGHTDATPYRSNNSYSNWELSTDRANSTGRALINAGLAESRIVWVVGMAAQEPLNVEDPFSAENRRISCSSFEKTTLLQRLSRFNKADFQLSLTAPSIVKPLIRPQIRGGIHNRGMARVRYTHPGNGHRQRGATERSV